jgi:AcrR family transcriptional regulator
MATPRGPQQLRAQRTRGDLLAAARRVFAELGYDGATVDDVAEAAGCSKGAYYFHFATKDDILLALFDAWASERTQQLREAGAADLLETLLVPETGGGWGTRLVIEFWEQSGRNARLQQKLTSLERSWRRLIESGLAGAANGRRTTGASVALVAQLALALHHGLIVQGCLGQVSRARAKECATTLESLIARPKTLRRAG